MPVRMIGRTIRRVLTWGGIAVVCGLILWVFILPGKAIQLRKIPHAPVHLESALHLDRYHVVMERVAISGIKENLSGLTYNPERHTMFGVMNKPASLVEISMGGRLLKLFRLRGFEDTEGVTFLGNNRFAVVEEYKHTIKTLFINPLGGITPHTQDPELVIGNYPRNNTGLEGIGFDYRDNLYVAKEIFPAACFRVSGFWATSMLSSTMTVVSFPLDTVALGIEDLSSIECDYGTGNLLILSQISKRAVEVTPAGEVLSTIHLVEGKHGLKATVLQPEGIATDHDGRLYVVSEPNLLYVFAKTDSTLPSSLETSAPRALVDAYAEAMRLR